MEIISTIILTLIMLQVTWLLGGFAWRAARSRHPTLVGFYTPKTLVRQGVLCATQAMNTVMSSIMRFLREKEKQRERWHKFPGLPKLEAQPPCARLQPHPLSN